MAGSFSPYEPLSDPRRLIPLSASSDGQEFSFASSSLHLLVDWRWLRSSFHVYKVPFFDFHFHFRTCNRMPFRTNPSRIPEGSWTPPFSYASCCVPVPSFECHFWAGTREFLPFLLSGSSFFRQFTTGHILFPYPLTFLFLFLHMISLYFLVFTDGCPF